jgi:hypothetical protein
MFSPAVVCDDKFIDMPSSTQALYFQLGMHADDDGFVGPKKVMRIIGASEDDLTILLAKGFVIPFKGDTVIVVRHWKVNNLVRKDWYRPTTYIEQRNQLKTASNGVYYLVNETVPEPLTQVGSKEGNYKGSKDPRNTELTHEEQLERIATIRDNLTRTKTI